MSIDCVSSSVNLACSSWRQVDTQFQKQKDFVVDPFLLRLVLAASVVVYAVVEILKFSSNKEILHLAMFSMFSLLQISRLASVTKAIINDEEEVYRSNIFFSLPLCLNWLIWRWIRC